MAKKRSVVPLERIERHILLVRGQKVMLDIDLAALYEVETKILNRAVKRNLERFPQDFMFQLTAEEFADLRFHSGTSSAATHGHRQKPDGRSQFLRCSRTMLYLAYPAVFE